jgi:hypothetical protein
VFFRPGVPLFIKDGDEELFDLSYWPIEFLDMEVIIEDRTV